MLKPGTLCYCINCNVILLGKFVTVLAPTTCPGCNGEAYEVTTPSGVYVPEGYTLNLHREQLVPINDPDQKVDVHTDEEITA